MTAIRSFARTLLPFGLAAGVAAGLAGCRGTARQPLSELDYPGTLQAPARLPVQAVWQQRVTAAWQAPGEPRQERGFDAALQRSGDDLTVIGLSPMGSIGFSIKQTKTDIEVTNNIPEQMVIPPRFILLDVQRAFFPTANASHRDGEHTVQQADERITETFREGRLQKRVFERLDGQPQGAITITYDWQQPTWALPTRAVLDNGWFGYQLTIVTHSETRLPPSPVPEGEERP